MFLAFRVKTLKLSKGKPQSLKCKTQHDAKEEETQKETRDQTSAMSSIASANKKKIALVAARIFQTALNDTNAPTGRKLLKKALVGPRLTSWYPEGIRKMDMLFEDPDDKRRKVKLERMKRRGKGPPKKGEGKRAKKK